MTLGERIALARKKAGLSQEQLGDRLGVSRQAVSKWESSQWPSCAGSAGCPATGCCWGRRGPGRRPPPGAGAAGPSSPAWTGTVPSADTPS